jgi:hypothetical protein
VTSWALLLLIVYVTLGLSRVGSVKAARLALVITVLVVSTVVARGGG